MTLQNYLYRILNVEETPEGTLYSISLIRECPIYKAHFPEMPVTPGACIVQMVEELAADHLQTGLQMTGVKEAKFLVPLEPSDDICLIRLSFLQLEQGNLKVQALVSDRADRLYARISIICKKKDIETWTPSNC